MLQHCLQTQKSNCKNCYKCIRHCPVKALKMTDGQAHIIHDECILCGECYVICPQNAKKIRNDTEAVKKLLQSGCEVYISLAPSYVAKYPGLSLTDFASALKKLGFSDVFETALGAEIVKTEYERMIREHNQKIIISTCCHSVNSLVERHYENALKYLANVVSPMQAHGMKIKKEHPGAKVVFIGPCISKKKEAEKYEGIIDAVLTFEELDTWLAAEGVVPERTHELVTRHRSALFPTSGGILKSMDFSDDYDYIVIDGIDKCMAVLEDIENGQLSNCFIEMSACSGSCVSGPVMKKQSRNPASDTISVIKNTDKNDYNIDVPDANTLVKRFEYEGKQHIMPGLTSIEEILRKMGKNTPEKELNCGSCGYDTCRQKALAVLSGKADLSMCLPYLKEKAESFSDTIIKNTPNGIIVLDEQLNIQLINNAARSILNLPSTTEIIGGPVVRILDPVDYILAFNDGKNIYDNKKYLAEYNKYIEETIICEKEYHIIMIMMKDVTGEEEMRLKKETKSKSAVEITDKVVEKQMRIAQEIASLLGETTAETKIALTKLKETLNDE